MAVFSANFTDTKVKLDGCMCPMDECWCSSEIKQVRCTRFSVGIIDNIFILKT